MARQRTWISEQQNKSFKKKDHSIPSDIEYQIQLRGGITEKHNIGFHVAEAYKNAKTTKDFFKTLEQQGHSLYERGGKVTGIQGEKRKYRFSTLGYSHERITNLNLETIEQKRRAELSLLRTKDKEQNNQRKR